MLVSGDGRVDLLHTIIWSLAVGNRQSRIQFVIISHNISAEIEKLPHMLEPIISRKRDAATILWRIHQEMKRRQRESIDTPHIVIVIDDVHEDLTRPISSLLSGGREAGIHLILSTSSPEALGGMLKHIPLHLYNEYAGFVARFSGQDMHFGLAHVPQNDHRILNDMVHQK